MSPALIAERADEAGLDIIAVCDHNSAENAAAVLKACSKRNLSAIAGIEITTSEEVHVIGLFPSVESAEEVQQMIFRNLSGENDAETFGMQVIASAADDVEGFNSRLLIGATGLSLEEAIELIHRHDGLAIAAHIDRESFSLISQLGFIPDDIDLDALELSAGTVHSGFDLPGEKSWTVITSSDAHRLGDIGCARTLFFAAEPTFAEVGLALKGAEGRRVEIGGA